VMVLVCAKALYYVECVYSNAVNFRAIVAQSSHRRHVCHCCCTSGDGASGEGGGEGSHALVVDGRGGLWQLGLNEIVSLKDPANPLGGFDVDIEVR